MAISEEDIANLLADFFANKNKCAQYTFADAPIDDSNVLNIEYAMREKLVHEREYVIFGKFKDRRHLILDVGANWGYSVTSMRVAGSHSQIFSFEPNACHEACMKELERVESERRTFVDKLLRRSTFGYLTVGISDVPGSLDFHVPVLNGKMISALATAATKPSVEALASHIMSYASLIDEEPNDVQIFSFTSKITTLDAWRSASKKRSKIVAIKIDTEGLEGEVLAGATRILDQDRPLVMAEGAERRPLALKVMSHHGYRFGRLCGDFLEPTNEIPSQMNTFFVHPSQEAYYRQIGVIQQVATAPRREVRLMR